MRAFLIFILCFQLCACSAARQFTPAPDGDGRAGERSWQEAGASDNATGASRADSGKENGGEPPEYPPAKDQGSVLVRTLKGVVGVVLAIVVIGVSIAAKVPAGAR